MEWKTLRGKLLIDGNRALLELYDGSLKELQTTQPDPWETDLDRQNRFFDHIKRYANQRMMVDCTIDRGEIYVNKFMCISDWPHYPDISLEELLSVVEGEYTWLKCKCGMYGSSRRLECAKCGRVLPNKQANKMV
jgi:hypothetical protein